MVQNKIISNFIQLSTKCFHVTGKETNLLLTSFISENTCQKFWIWGDFLGDPVVKNLLCNIADRALTPGRELRSHMPRAAQPARRPKHFTRCDKHLLRHSGGLTPSNNQLSKFWAFLCVLLKYRHL